VWPREWAGLDGRRSVGMLLLGRAPKTGELCWNERGQVRVPGIELVWQGITGNVAGAWAAAAGELDRVSLPVGVKWYVAYLGPGAALQQ